MIYKNDLFHGQTVLVTGGGSGIGFAIARLFGELGARVVIAGRDINRLQKACAALQSDGIEVISQSLNLRDEASVALLFESLVSRGVTVDILVNNAGGQFAAPALDISPNGFRSVVDLNLTGTFLMSQAFAHHCIDSGCSGSVVNIVLSQHSGLPGMAHAGSAREGVVNLTKTLAWEWAEHGIRINAVAPGTIKTEALSQYDGNALENSIQKLLVKRMGSPLEVAQGVVYLASPAAGYITGVCLALDGGEHLTGASPQR